MALDTPARIAIVRAGPTGLEAALYARFLGYDVEIYEQADVAAAVRVVAHQLMPTSSRGPHRLVSLHFRLKETGSNCPPRRHRSLRTLARKLSSSSFSSPISCKGASTRDSCRGRPWSDDCRMGSLFKPLQRTTRNKLLPTPRRTTKANQKLKKMLIPTTSKKSSPWSWRSQVRINGDSGGRT